MQVWPLLLLVAAAAAHPPTEVNGPNDKTGFWDWLFSGEDDSDGDSDNEILIPRDHELANANAPTCETDECKKMAQFILDGLNEKANPCDNFYEYACGSWPAKYPIPPNELQTTSDDVKGKLANEQIRDVLKEEFKPDDNEALKMAKRWYRSCMNTEMLENMKVHRIQQILDETGGWPITMPAKEVESYNQTWQRIDRVYGRLFDLHAFFDVIAATGKEIAITQQNDYPLREQRPARKNFELDSVKENVIAEIALEFARRRKSNVSREAIAEQATKIYNFENALKELSKKEKEMGILDTFAGTTFDKLQKWYDHFETNNTNVKLDWLETINYIIQDTGVTYTKTDNVTVVDKYILRRLQRLLAKTPTTVIVNYVQWRIVAKLLPHADKKMRELILKAQNADMDVTEDEPRWKTCVEGMELKHALAVKHVLKRTGKQAKARVSKLAKGLQQVYASRIEQSSWLSEKMKRKLANKVRHIHKNIIYPSWYEDESAVDDYYKGLTIGPKYIDNVLNYLRFKALKKYAVLTADKDDENTVWADTFPTTVNAFYKPSDNAIVIPAGIMPYPLLEPSLPEAIFYGSVGASTVGHEIGHSLDNNGVRYTKNGTETLWPTLELMEKYKERSDCFIDQYRDYVVPNSSEPDEVIEVDGRKCINDNIADAVGVQLGYQLFQRRRDEVDYVARKLPGLEKFNDLQLFFLSFGNAWCANVSPIMDEFSIANDEHSPAKFRVIGALSNLEGFADVFGCKKEDRMNPEEKCDLWK